LSSSPTDANGQGVNNSTLYYVAHTSNRIALYDGSAWVMRTWPSASSPVLDFHSPSAPTADVVSDVFARWENNAVKLVRVDWPEPFTARSVNLEVKDGIYTGASYEDRYLGTVFYAKAFNTVGATIASQGVWNMYHRLRRLANARPLYDPSATTTVSYTMSPTTWSPMGGSAASNTITAVFGLPTAVMLGTTLHAQAGQNEFQSGILYRHGNTAAYTDNPAIAMAGAMANQDVRGMTGIDMYHAAAGLHSFQYVGRNAATANATVYGGGIHVGKSCPASQLWGTWHA